MKVSEERVAFFHCIGEALAQWAYTENQLWSVSSLAVPVPQRPTIIRGIMAVENFRSRLAMCDEMIRHAFKGKAHLERWAEIHDDLSKASTKRNQLAHRVPVLYLEGETGRHFALEEWAPDGKSTRGGARPTTSALCVQQIAHYRLEFHRLTSQLASYRSLIETGHPLPPAFDVQAESQPAIREIRNPIRVALGLPPLQPRSKGSKLS